MRILRTSVPCLFSRESICNLTTLTLEDNYVCGHNLANIGKYCVRLEVLYLQGYGIFTHVGLMDICMGCTQLKKLYLDLESMIEYTSDTDTDRTELVKFALELWKKVRPGLVIECTNIFPFYDVMAMV